MEKKTITLDYQEYLKLEEKIKLLEASTSELTVIRQYNECYYFPYYSNPRSYTTYRFGLNLTAEMQDELVQKLLCIKEENEKVLGEISKQRPLQRNELQSTAVFLQRLKYLFTGKLD